MSHNDLLRWLRGLSGLSLPSGQVSQDSWEALLDELEKDGFVRTDSRVEEEPPDNYGGTA